MPAKEAIMGKRLNDNRVNNTQKYTWLFKRRFTADTFIYIFFTLINDIIHENTAQIEFDYRHVLNISQSITWLYARPDTDKDG